MIFGVDVSGWQPPKLFDWREAREQSDVRFVYAKATEGRKRMRKSFPVHTARARDAGLHVGAYHFAYCKGGGIKNPEEQAEAFAAFVGELAPGDLPPALDFEPPYNSDVFPAAACVEWCHRFLTRARELFGVTLVFYTGSSYWKYRLRKSKAFRDCPLWQASPKYREWSEPEIGAAPRSMVQPKGPWPQLDIWQFSHKGRIHGFPDHRIDRNVFLGDEDAFARFLVRGSQ